MQKREAAWNVKIEVPAKKIIEMYEMMLCIRLAEEKLVELHPEQMMKTPFHLYIGQEAIATGVCAALTKQDVVFSNHRSHGHYLAKGGDLNRFMAEMYCKIDGCSCGKGGSMHLIDTSVGHMGSSSIVSGSIPIAVGAALAFRMQNKKNVSVAFFGDGATDEGVLYESYNFAALKKLPVIFICENNFYAINSKITTRQAVDNLPGRAIAFGVPGEKIDGNDVLKVYQTTEKMVKRAKQGHGPGFIEAVSYRWKAHIGVTEDVGEGIRPEEELTEWKKKCPIKNYEKYLLNEGIMTKQKLMNMNEKIQHLVNKAVEFGRKSPLPDACELLEDVFI
ncbi:MAG: thiamine pyrophosphate-dependent dehydrogenase E1 component subunit alpha [Candidatus Aenigmarchaeota archaeon]|nr:thiamine pyrophosphate-dependent dehydrogenase E1 component subunit alpha [Candidatus Aenigmarchaeota archaeon]